MQDPAYFCFPRGVNTLATRLLCADRPPFGVGVNGDVPALVLDTLGLNILSEALKILNSFKRAHKFLPGVSNVESRVCFKCNLYANDNLDLIL